MKKVLFIFLILISCLCLAVVSCAVKEESSTDTTSTASIVDGSAEGYMKIGNMLMVWGSANLTQSGTTITFPKSFLNTPKVLIQGIHSNGTSQNVTNVTTTSAVLYHGWNSSTSLPYDYLVVGKWQ